MINVILRSYCDEKEIVKMTDMEKWLEYRNRISMGLGLEGEQTRWVFDKALMFIEKKAKLIELLEEEVKFARSINANYHMILGLQQAITIIKNEKASD